MKKKTLKIAVAAMVVAAAGYGLFLNQSKDNGMSELALANVEALATGESGYSVACYTTFTGADWFHKDQYFVDCYTCQRDKGRNLLDRGECIVP